MVARDARVARDGGKGLLRRDSGEFGEADRLFYILMVTVAPALCTQSSKLGEMNTKYNLLTYINYSMLRLL